jgi:predicted nucleotidyltransferase
MNLPNGSIFQEARPTLAPIWGKDLLLKEPIREQIMEGVRMFEEIHGAKVAAIYLLGSVASYKWTDSSDIDVNMAIVEPTAEMKNLKSIKALSGQVAHGTPHNINFFMSTWNPDILKILAESPLGAYDVLNNRWLSMPPRPETFRHPRDEFGHILHGAHLTHRIFNKKMQSWREATGLAKQLIFDDLKYFTREMDGKRKAQYNHGWGVPRYSANNVLFKTLDHGDEAKAFEILKDLVSLDNKKRRQLIKP